MKPAKVVPNRKTVEAMRAADRGEGKRFASAEALLRDLGIPNGYQAPNSGR
jgi:hypothetical protein